MDETICWSAAQGGHLEVFIWLKEIGCPVSEQCFQLAAENGDLKMMKWMWKNECPLGKKEINASKAHHLHVIKWLRKKGYSWGPGAYDLPAIHGDVEALKYLKENGCPWGEWVTETAAFYGNVEFLKWAVENGCPYNAYRALLNAPHHVVVWARENGMTSAWTSLCIRFLKFTGLDLCSIQ